MAMNKGLANIAQTYGLQQAGDMAVDLIDGCPVTLKLNNGNLFVRAAMPKEVFEASKAAMNEQLKSVKMAKAGYTGGQVQFILSKWKLAEEQYGMAARLIREYAAPQAGQAVCPYCGQPGCDAAAIYKDNYTRVHSRCHHVQADSKRDVVVTGEGNIITGIIGAFVGAMLFMILCLIIVSITQTVYGWLFVFASYASVFGYKLLKGPYGTAGTVSVAVSSIVAFLLYMVGEMTYFIADYYSMTIGQVSRIIGDIVSLTFSTENLADSWFQILFFVIGVILVLVRRPLSQQNVLNEMDAIDAFTKPLDDQM